MKKIKIALGIVVIGVLVIAGVVLAAANSQTSQRVYVLTDNSVVKTILGVNQEFPGVFSTGVSPQVKVLSALGLIKTEPVQIYEIAGKPTNPSKKPPQNEGRTCVPSKQYPWGIVKVNGGSGGAGVNVAVLDTGVYKDHLDLKANVVDCKDATKVGIRNGCADNNGHGTHVAGTVLANGGADGKGIYGVAPEAKLMAIKVCGGQFCFGDDMAAGIRYAADSGANIISMSIGGNTPDSQVLSAIDYAVSKDVLVVAAAGNDGPADGSIDYPGAYYKVIAAGAIDINEQVPYWSSRGVNDGDSVIEEREVEFGTPGVSVESTYKDGCYTLMSGTSMATPHVSGLAAKFWQGSASATRSSLQSIARDIWTPGNDTATGFGLPVAP